MKRSIRNYLTGCFLFIFLFLAVPAGRAAAAGLTQTGASANSVTVQWSAPGSREVIRYSVYVGTSAQDAALYASPSASETSITITGLPQGVSRYVRVTYDYYNYNGTQTITSTLGALGSVRTVPGKPVNVSMVSWFYNARAFYAKWDSIESADGYEYVIKTNGGKLKTQGNISNTAKTPVVSAASVSNTLVYTVQVRAYSDINGTRCYGEWSDPCYCFTQPQVSRVRVSGSRLTVKWSRVTGATGYDVYVSTRKTSGYKKVKSVKKSTSSITLKKYRGKKISSKKKYYAYVVAKKTVGSTTYTSTTQYYWNSKNTGRGYF